METIVKAHAVFFKNLFILLYLTPLALSVTFLVGVPPCLEIEKSYAAPLDFSLKTIEGEEVCLKDYRGKKMVHLLLWAAWCPHCLIEIPKLNKLYQAIGERPYEILAIDVAPNDSLKRIKKIQEQYRIPCKVIFDKEGKVAKSCGVVGVPLHIVIDKEGVEKNRFNELPDDPITYFNLLFPR